MRENETLMLPIRNAEVLGELEDCDKEEPQSDADNLSLVRTARQVEYALDIAAAMLGSRAEDGERFETHDAIAIADLILRHHARREDAARLRDRESGEHVIAEAIRSLLYALKYSKDTGLSVAEAIEVAARTIAEASK